MSRSLAMDLVAWRRHLHAHPEVAFAEHDTTRWIAERLASFAEPGLRVRRGLPPAGTGVMVELTAPPGQSTGVVGLRADIDALPIGDAKSASYRSCRDGVAHLCGHDAHTAMALGAVRVLSALRSALRVDVRVLFQAAEEKIPGGAQALVEAGLADDLSSIVALHVYSGLPTGTLGLRTGPLLASADEFTITLHGVGGHAAAPHRARDPIVACAEVITAAQSIVARNVDPLRPAVLSICRWQAGTADNVIPQTAMLAGTLRALDESVRDLLARRLRELSTGIAAAHGLRAEVAIARGYPVMINHPAVVERLRDGLTSLWGTQARIVEVEPKCGAEDFAYFAQRVPAAMAWLGSGNPSRGTHHAHHHPLFDVDEDALPLGTALLAQWCLSHGR